jgi:hypothetical protein
MINNIPITPLRSIRARPISIIKSTSSQEQIINLIPAQLGQSLLNKYLHTPQTLQIKWQDVNGVLGRIKTERVVRSLGSLRVSGTEDETVRLGFFE